MCDVAYAALQVQTGLPTSLLYQLESQPPGPSPGTITLDDIHNSHELSARKLVFLYEKNTDNKKKKKKG